MARSAKKVTSKLSTRRRAPVDEQAATELELYIENDGSLYNQKKSIIANLEKKIRKGIYDEAKAAKLWLYWVDAGARKYVREFGSGGTVDTIFNKPTRERVARELARRINPDAILRGDY